MDISFATILVYFLCHSFIKVTSLPNGAPYAACSNMVPQHAGTQPQNPETSPFSLIQPSAYFPGQTSSIIVESNDPSRKISGLLLQARRVGNGVPNDISAIVGTWNLLSGLNDGYRLTECNHPNDTVTHRTPNSDTEVLFLWRAPEDLMDGVQFVVTVAEDFTTYWPRLSSGQVAYPAGQSGDLPCESSPCQNGGTCSNNGRLFACTCPASFEGQFCENVVPSIAPCDSQPCLNGGSCFDLNNEGNFQFVCLCTNGFGGITCQLPASSPCDSSPCQNGGTCSNNGRLFTCTCPVGFEGQFCENEVPRITPCASQPCQNGGTCIDLGTEQQSPFFCICTDAYEGITCQTVSRIAPCDSQPCLNGGTCLDVGIDSEEQSFFCLCAEGYDGITCQTGVTDPCISSPCANGGFCFSSENGNMFVCLCFGVFSGPTCETVSIDTDLCVESPCQNGGTCVINEDLVSTRCMCPLSYAGPYCETAVCLEGYCKNGATCRVLSGESTCFCLPGYTGPTCETPVCPEGYCRNGATCRVLNGENACFCQPGYTGLTCETPVCPEGYCQNGATCRVFNGDIACSCLSGYTGPTCETPVCPEGYCQNGATCRVLNGEIACFCLPGFTGATCDTPVCPVGYCQNGATCRVLNGENTCFCLSDFTGATCETRITACTSNPCDGGGTCIERDNGQFQCMCPERREGVRCETFVCPPRYCDNGGSCSVTMETRGDGGERYVCRCAPGFTGERCQEDIDECESSPCQNNGRCVNDFNQFHCNCQPGFGGMFCEQHCVANFECQNYGTCVFNEREGSVFCECLPGYSGDRCEIDEDECKSNPCPDDSVCIDHINGYQCKCLSSSSQGCENTASQVKACADSDRCPVGSVCIDMYSGFYCICPEEIEGDSSCGQFIEVEVDESPEDMPSGVNRPFRFG